jgi:hypothetical protein
VLFKHFLQFLLAVTLPAGALLHQLSPDSSLKTLIENIYALLTPKAITMTLPEEFYFAFWMEKTIKQ